jgi:DNA-binding HxlR family transcriptional regulator
VRRPESLHARGSRGDTGFEKLQRQHSPTYRQYCPVALASEVLAERWNPLIVRNLMFGADTFSAIDSASHRFKPM